MTLREEIREAMRAQGVSQYFLAKVTGISASAISRFLTTKLDQQTDLPSDRVDKLREALGISNGKRKS